MFHIFLRTLRNRLRNKGREIAPDEIFVDAHNLPSFDRNQMEGRLEYPLSPRVAFILLIIFALTFIGFTVQAFKLQIIEGANYAEHSQNNRLHQVALFADRGVVFDRNGKRLAWNVHNPHTNDFSLRRYATSTGVAHVLGYVSYPKKDTSGIYYQTSFDGVSGIEHAFNNALSGVHGKKIIEVNALGSQQSESTFMEPQAGDTLTLSIDIDLQRALFEEIRTTAVENEYTGGSGVIMDVHSGEIIALVSYPEFDSQILVDGDNERIQAYLSDSKKPFLNRALQGLYSPGSIIKPFMSVAALEEDIIDPQTEIRSTGSITIPNPYFPDQPTVFRDWKAHGWTDMRESIAVSSDVYFYAIGGGLRPEHGYAHQEGLGIERIERYMRLFGFGQPTGLQLEGEASGVIPNPEWKKQNFDGEEWLLGNTYHTSIGQYGFKVTALQAARATAALANGGLLITPRLTIAGGEESVSFTDLELEQEHLRIAQEGMRLTVTDGTAIGLNMSDIKIAAKTGTAEVGLPITHMNAWLVGFFPYENPRYAFAVVLERAPKGTPIGGVRVMRGFFDKIRSTHPHWFGQ